MFTCVCVGVSHLPFPQPHPQNELKHLFGHFSQQLKKQTKTTTSPTPLSFLLNKTLCCNLHLKYCRKYLFKNTYKKKKTQEQNFLINPTKPFELCIFILVLSCVPPSPLSLISILLSYCICIVFSCLFLSSSHTSLT